LFFQLVYPLQLRVREKGQGASESEYDRRNRASTTRFKRADTTTEETRAFTYNKVDKPLSVADMNGSTTYVYDELYRITSESRATKGCRDSYE
ncbi:MAG: hypothetical protein AAB250_07345, partial [Bdellovibrionota bacterium]